MYWEFESSGTSGIAKGHCPNRSGDVDACDKPCEQGKPPEVSSKNSKK